MDLEKRILVTGGCWFSSARIFANACLPMERSSSASITSSTGARRNIEHLLDHKALRSDPA